MSKRPKGDPFPLPSADPAVEGATLRFFTTNATAPSPYVALPASGWTGLGNPVGSAGWKYQGTGSGTDPCKVVLIKERVIKAVCTGPSAFDSPSTYTLPIGSYAAAWELILGSDRYCARSTRGSPTKVKDDPAKGIFKAKNAGYVTVPQFPGCAACDHDVCEQGAPLLRSCSSCAATVCEAYPGCCTDGWFDYCVDRVDVYCGGCAPAP